MFTILCSLLRVALVRGTRAPVHSGHVHSVLPAAGGRREGHRQREERAARAARAAAHASAVPVRAHAALL